MRVTAKLSSAVGSGLWSGSQHVSRWILGCALHCCVFTFVLASTSRVAQSSWRARAATCRSLCSFDESCDTDFFCFPFFELLSSPLWTVTWMWEQNQLLQHLGFCSNCLKYIPSKTSSVGCVPMAMMASRDHPRISVVTRRRLNKFGAGHLCGRGGCLRESILLQESARFSPRATDVALLHCEPKAHRADGKLQEHLLTTAWFPLVFAARVAMNLRCGFQCYVAALPSAVNLVTFEPVSVVFGSCGGRACCLVRTRGWQRDEVGAPVRAWFLVVSSLTDSKSFTLNECTRQDRWPNVTQCVARIFLQ